MKNKQWRKKKKRKIDESTVFRYPSILQVQGPILNQFQFQLNQESNIITVEVKNTFMTSDDTMETDRVQGNKNRKSELLR